jgi:hypothetical protein
LLSQLKPWRPPARLAATAAATSFIAIAMPVAGSAAALPPESTASCYGSLTPTATADEPNSLTYKFHCDERITAYTVVVDRGLNDYSTIDDFSTAAEVLGPDGKTPDATTSWGCQGYNPGASVSCNTGGGTTYMGAGSYAEGSFDPTGPYCKYIPTGARPGTPAEPRLLVQLIVSDSTGAEDGPFSLPYKGRCPTVPDRAPRPAKDKRGKHRTKRRKGSK